MRLDFSQDRVVLDSFCRACDTVSAGMVSHKTALEIQGGLADATDPETGERIPIAVVVVAGKHFAAEVNRAVDAILARHGEMDAGCRTTRKSPENAPHNEEPPR